MKPIYKIAVVIVPLLVTTLVTDAHARRGRGAAFAVGVAAGSAKSHSAEPTSAERPAAAPGSPLPVGTVVAALPEGCTKTPVDGVNYYSCGGNYYQPVYEGSTLKYITTKPK